MNQGWLCPTCGTVCAPWLPTCPGDHTTGKTTTAALTLNVQSGPKVRESVAETYLRVLRSITADPDVLAAAERTANRPLPPVDRTEETP